MYVHYPILFNTGNAQDLICSPWSHTFTLPAQVLTTLVTGDYTGDHQLLFGTAAETSARVSNFTEALVLTYHSLQLALSETGMGVGVGTVNLPEDEEADNANISTNGASVGKDITRGSSGSTMVVARPFSTAKTGTNGSTSTTVSASNASNNGPDSTDLSHIAWGYGRMLDEGSCSSHVVRDGNDPGHACCAGSDQNVGLAEEKEIATYTGTTNASINANAANAGSASTIVTGTMKTPNTCGSATARGCRLGSQMSMNSRSPGHGRSSVQVS